ncbi:MAG: hypothetical protein JSS75_09790 [Bacteroidetes bacterium]|nr:hypothetical protein [Bacteroidota bacterium]
MKTLHAFQARNRTLAFCVMLLALFIAVGQAEATTVTVTITLGQGKLKWNGKKGEDCDCDKNGNDCKIKITIQNVANVSDGGTTWQFDGTITSAQAEMTPIGEPSFDATIPGANFPFPDGSYLDVPDNAFPGVPGFHIPLDNIVCDASGNFSGAVPK